MGSAIEYPDQFELVPFGRVRENSYPSVSRCSPKDMTPSDDRPTSYSKVWAFARLLRRVAQDTRPAAPWSEGRTTQELGREWENYRRRVSGCQ